jgi:hypothetical protein
MKIPIKANGKEFIGVSVPVDSFNYVLPKWEFYMGLCYEQPNILGRSIKLNYPKGTKIIGSFLPQTREIDFEVEDGWVNKITIGSHKEYENHLSSNVPLFSEEESFISLLLKSILDAGMENKIYKMIILEKV